jgi:hypothetical protein
MHITLYAGSYLGIWHQGATIKNVSLYQIQISAVEKDLSEEQFIAGVHKNILSAMST